jgi:hypothetical protein
MQLAYEYPNKCLPLVSDYSMDRKVLSRTLADSYNVSNVSHCVQVTSGIGPEKPCHHIGECAVELLQPCKLEG